MERIPLKMMGETNLGTQSHMLDQEQHPATTNSGATALSPPCSLRSSRRGRRRLIRLRVHGNEAQAWVEFAVEKFAATEAEMDRGPMPAPGPATDRTDDVLDDDELDLCLICVCER